MRTVAVIVITMVLTTLLVRSRERDRHPATWTAAHLWTDDWTRWSETTGPLS